MIGALDRGNSALHKLDALLEIAAFCQQDAMNEKRPLLKIFETMLDTVVQGFIGVNLRTL